MLIDLHVHTTRYSAGCSVLEPQELCRAAKKAGLDGVVLSEHQCRWDNGELAALQGNGILFLAGREVDFGNLHVLVFGLHGELPAAADGPALAREVDRLGGAAVLAHPFRFGRSKDFPLESLAPVWSAFHAVEALTCSHLPEENRAALAAALALGLPATGGSDAHANHQVGRFSTFFSYPIANEADLVEALREGACRPHKTSANY